MVQTVQRRDPVRPVLPCLDRHARHMDGLCQIRRPAPDPANRQTDLDDRLRFLCRANSLEFLILSAYKSAIPTRRFYAVIICACGSGMRASLQLAEAGLNVAVLSKVFPTRSHTVAAQGSIGATVGNVADDNWFWHMFDT